MPEDKITLLIRMIREKAETSDISSIKEKFAAEFQITGEGVFYVEVRDGKISIEPYEYNDRDLLIKASADTLKKIINKELSIEKALITRKNRGAKEAGSRKAFEGSNRRYRLLRKPYFSVCRGFHSTGMAGTI